jgi:ferrous iron transport protein B
MAYMLDRVLRVFGLHGCSVMPFIISGGIAGGCAVPGIMAARTLRSPKEKIATLLNRALHGLRCQGSGVHSAVGGVFRGIGGRGHVLHHHGRLGGALLVSWLLRKTLIRGASTPFVMELPPYRLPALRGICIHTGERIGEYVKKAGTVILAISVLLWAAMTFPSLPQHEVKRFDAARQGIAAEAEGAESKRAALDHEQAKASLRHSLAGRAGIALEGITKLAGFDWRTNIALVGGLAAKEVIVSTLGTAYSLGAVDARESESLGERLAGDRAWSPLTAACLIIFVLLYSPCFVTLVVMAREASWKWAAFSMVFNTAFAFSTAALVYQIGSRCS